MIVFSLHKDTGSNNGLLYRNASQGGVSELFYNQIIIWMAFKNLFLHWEKIPFDKSSEARTWRSITLKSDWKKCFYSSVVKDERYPTPCKKDHLTPDTWSMSYPCSKALQQPSNLRSKLKTTVKCHQHSNTFSINSSLQNQLHTLWQYFETVMVKTPSTVTHTNQRCSSSCYSFAIMAHTDAQRV